MYRNKGINSNTWILGPGVLYQTHFEVWVRGLDNFKTIAKETLGNRNMVSAENATNFIDWKQNSVTRR